MMIAFPLILAGASLALQAGSSLLGHRAQANKAKANRQAARRARIRALGDLSIRRVQEDQAISLEQDQVGQIATQSTGTAEAAAGAANVKGMSLDLLLGDLEGSGGRARSLLERNREFMNLDLDRRGQGAREEYAARAAGVASPNPWITGLSIAGSALSAYTQYDSLRRPI